MNTTCSIFGLEMGAVNEVKSLINVIVSATVRGIAGQFDIDMKG